MNTFTILVAIVGPIIASALYMIFSLFLLFDEGGKATLRLFRWAITLYLSSVAVWQIMTANLVTHSSRFAFILPLVALVHTNTMWLIGVFVDADRDARPPSPSEKFFQAVLKAFAPERKKP